MPLIGDGKCYPNLIFRRFRVTKLGFSVRISETFPRKANSPKSLAWRWLRWASIITWFLSVAHTIAKQHVGVRRYSTFLSQIYNLLDDDGIFVFQVAGIRPFWQYEDLVWGLFMNKYVFPGADASCSLGWVISKVRKVISPLYDFHFNWCIGLVISSSLLDLRLRTLMFWVFIILLQSTAGTRTGSPTRTRCWRSMARDGSESGPFSWPGASFPAGKFLSGGKGHKSDCSIAKEVPLCSRSPCTRTWMHITVSTASGTITPSTSRPKRSQCEFNIGLILFCSLFVLTWHWFVTRFLPLLSMDHNFWSCDQSYRVKR